MNPESDKNPESRGRLQQAFGTIGKLLKRSRFLCVALPVIVASVSLLAGLQLCNNDGKSSGNRAQGESGVTKARREASSQPPESLLKLAKQAEEEDEYARAAELYEVAIRRAEKQGEPNRALLARH